MRRFVLLLLLVGWIPLRADAQTAPDSVRVVKISPAIGLHYGIPLRFSLAAGGMFDFFGRRNDGVIIVAEAGQGGAELSTGYFRMQRFGQGYSFRLAGVRTNDDPWNASASTTYVGAEAHWMVFLGAGGRAGWYRRVSGGADESLRDDVWAVGVSLGY